LIVTLILWSPWISWQNPQLIFEPLSAIFPIHRGLYQLKVPNFWCVTDVFMKWETKFSNNILVILCALLSLITSIPSILIGIVFPNNNRLTLLVFLNISLTFFFFSYHVH
jgi:alpha-1,3-glucosyltransferase